LFRVSYLGFRISKQAEDQLAKIPVTRAKPYYRNMIFNWWERLPAANKANLKQ